MKRCNRCVLPETFPGIHFNDEGVCNFCLDFKGVESLVKEKADYLSRFEELLATIKGKGDYDCTVSYSGGKDSSYTLCILKKRYNLRVLALTLDNGFISDQAHKNINTITENVGVDSLIYKPDFNILKKVFRSAVDKPMYSAKSLDRASTICTSCIGLVKFIFLKIALEKKIPLMAWGWSPGQAPIRSSIMKINPQLFRMTQEAIKKPMHDIVGDDINPYFLRDEDFDRTEMFPYNVSPLAFLDYDEEKILDTIRSLGWQSPLDVDSNSTNCLLNSFANQIHMDRYGFHPYAFEIAGLVRTGVMSREEGLKKISDPGNKETIEFAKKRLGID